MRLLAIEMQGFKSFPEKTRIAFDRGVTAIIGPNGSGKSNISDAVRWVLGETSAKQLRGTRMEDVIFNGSQSRPQSNFASVSLFFDTSEEHSEAHPLEIKTETVAGAKPTFTDSPETVITRKYYRTGESEYYVNKRQVRQKDVHELFADTGIGREGYSVIGQGKISEVLSQKDDERRRMFEDAAGVSRFRIKKDEAERKLRDTESNLERIEDILGEVTSRLAPLEKEAQNAKAYLELAEEKRGLEITAWLDRIDALREKRVQFSQILFTANYEYEKACSEVETARAELDKSVDEGYQQAMIMSTCEQTKTEKERVRGEAEAKKAVCQNNIAHFNIEIERAKETVSAAEIRINDLKIQSKDLEEECKKAKDSAEAAALECENAFHTCEQKRALSAKAAEEYAAILENLSRLNSKAAELNASKAAALATKEAALRSESENEQRVAEGQKRLEQTEAEITQRKTDEESAQKGFEKASFEAVDVENQIEEKRMLEKSLTEAQTAKRIEISACEQRRESLRRMETLLEGYSDSVKSVISDARSGKIPNVTIYGTVSNIITAPEEYVIAAETALGAAVQFVVTGDEDDAKACIRYLKANKLGRATFLPLDTVKGEITDIKAVTGIKGFVGRASDIVNYDKKYAGIACDLLGRTLVAEDLDCATEIAKKTGYKIKIVTLDGQMIHPGGSYTGGSAGKKSGILSRSLDIKKLTDEIKALEKDISDKDREISAVRASLSTLDKQKVSYFAARDVSRDRLSSAISAKKVAIARAEEEKRHIEALKNGIISGGESLSALLASIEEFEKQANAIQNEILSATQLSNSKKDAVAAAKGEEENANNALNTANITLIEKKTDYEKQCERYSRIDNELTSETEKQKTALESGEQAQKGMQMASLALDDAQKDIDAALFEIAECDKKLALLVQGGEQREQEKSLLRVALENKQKTKEEALVRQTEQKAAAEAVETEYDGLVEKLSEDYQLTYTDAEAYRLPPEKTVNSASRIATLRRKIRAMGAINPNAVEEYKATKERFDFLTAQTSDLRETRRLLDGTISRLNSQMKDVFITTTQKISEVFGEVFSELFGGGKASVELTDPMLPLDCGIDITVKPPGKSVRSISLLSGGEQSFAAIALYLALGRVNPSPFCIFDEIESALDDVNLAKFADYMRRRSAYTQYIVITHRRGTMERADTLYGVTMRQKGVSDYIKLNLAMLEQQIKEYSD